MENLSGGELQRFAIAAVAIQEANVYMIDEPSSYLDVRQRLKAAKVWGVGGGRVNNTSCAVKYEHLAKWHSMCGRNRMCTVLVML